MFKIDRLIDDAKKKQKTIVFPEVSFSDRTVEAVKFLQKKGIVKVLLVGDASALILRDKCFEKFDIVNPVTFPDRAKLVKTLYEKRKEKGLTLEQADELEKDPYYFATLLVECGYADGMVAGAESSTATTVRPALQIIKAKNKKDKVSSCFLLYGKNKFLKGKALILSDCGVLEEPDADTLANIASQSVKSAKAFGLEPRVAFLSYSSKGSAKSENVDKVRTAFEKFKKKEKDVVCDGELQFDSAMVPSVAELKAPESPLKGDANVLIFPDLEAGNICYKAMQYVGRLNAVGPILQGLRKPVNDLSRGCTVEDIVVLSAITALQCEEKDTKEIKGEVK
ncbi:MAG: phosphate acetyltransferase [Candidatus Caccovivens sp.]